MKRKILLILFCLIACVVNAQTAAEKKLPWDYPVKPNMKKWEQLQTVKERIDICQIQENLLSSLSTDDLTDVCMQYPLLGVVLAWSPHDRGLDSLFREFNGVRELYKRKDAYKHLLNWYDSTMQNLPFLNKDVPLVEKGSFCSKISIAELLLSRCQLPDDANKDNNYREIIRHLVSGYEKTFAYPEYFTAYSFSISCFARAKIINKIDEQYIVKMPVDDKNTLFTRRHLDDLTRSAIDELSYQFIQEK